MALKFSDQFDELARLFRIRRSHVEAVVEEPDHQETLRVGTSETRLFLSYIPRRRPPIFLLVEMTVTNGEREVVNAWPIPPELVTDDPTPSTALRSLCEEFGGLIRAGDQLAELFLGGPELPSRNLSKEEVFGKFIQFAEPKPGETPPRFLGSFMLTQDPGGSNPKIAILYSINVNRLAGAVR